MMAEGRCSVSLMLGSWARAAGFRFVYSAYTMQETGIKVAE